MAAEKRQFHGQHHGVSISAFQSVSKYLTLSTFIVCSCFAGAMSGLTVGLLSIDMLELEIKA
jgi:hypothetical protein